MPKRAEKRADPDDGLKYSNAEFIEFYGEKKGTKRWEQAGQAPAPKAKAKAKVKAKAKAKAEKGPRKPRVDDDLVEAAIKEATATPAKTVEIIGPVDEGVPGPEHFKISEEPVGDVLDGGLLLQVLYMSPDPYMRGGLKTAVAGNKVRGFVCGRVLVSKSPKWHPGDFLGTSAPFTTVQVLSEEHLNGLVWRLTGLVDETNASRGVGILGMPGATAYGGFQDVLRPKRPNKKGEANGEVLFVSAASGAVGQIVGQLGKLAGCKVIGSAGGPDKCKTLKDNFGFDHAIDYKTCADAEALKAKIKECEDGLDMYFENVGGMHFDASLACLKPSGRIAVCGCISGYNDKAPEPSKLSLGALIYPQLRIEGFVSTTWLTGRKGKGAWLRDNARHLKNGEIKITETEHVGIETFGAAFQSLFKGSNNGKVVVKVADVKPLRAPKPEKAEES